MGGFSPKISDIEVLVVTNKPKDIEKKINLAQFKLFSTTLNMRSTL